MEKIEQPPVSLVEKKQPISQDDLYNIKYFLDMLKSKDVQSFALCFVDRENDLHSIMSSDSDHKLHVAIEHLRTLSLMS